MTMIFRYNISNSVRLITIIALMAIPFAAFAEKTSAGESIETLKKDYFMRQIRANRNNPVLSIIMADSLITLSENSVDSLKWNIYKTFMLINKSDYYKADSLLSDIESSGEFDMLSLPLKIDMLDYRMRINQNIMDYANALKNAHDILALPKPDSLKYRDFQTYLRLQSLFTSLDMPEQSNQYIVKAKNWLTEYRHSLGKTDKTELECQLLGAEARDEASKGNYVAALDKCNRILSLSEDPGILFAATVHRAMIYQSKGELKIASHYLEDAMKMNVEDSNRGVSLVSYCELQNKQGNFGKTLSLLDSLEKAGNLNVNTECRLNLDKARAYALKATGNYEEATFYFSRAIADMDSIEESFSQIRLNLMKNQLKDRAAVEAFGEIRIGAFILTAIIGIMVFICIIVLITYRNRIKSLKNQSITVRNNSYQVLLDSSKSSRSLIEQNTLLEESAKEATAALMRLAQITEAFESINMTTRNSSLTSNEKLSEIKKIVSELHSSEDIWEMYKILFLNINRGFYDNLAAAHPDLTNAELRMCGYILLNLSTKEIATLTNRSIRTVETIKYNLRKKMNIDIPTNSYLRTFATT